MSRRGFMGFAAVAALGAVAYPTEIERHELDVVHQTIRLNKLPDAFQGLRIAQLSDIHFDEFTEPFFVRQAVAKINALKPDIVLLTGDYISDNPLPPSFAARHAEPCAQILSSIQCPMRYAVLGNHDVVVNPGAVVDALSQHGIPVLLNRNVPVERDGKRIWIAGVEDPGTQDPDLDKAVPKTARKDGEAVILMAHAPDYADDVVGHGVDLMLAGHSHGGQVRVPFMTPHFLPRLGKKYVQGHFQLAGGLQLYTNRGLGTVFVPMRFRCPPELTMLTLT